jgi:signal transduction histidine kinase
MLHAMRIGQHLIGLALAVICVVRAVAEGTQPAVAIAAGSAAIAWYAAGVVLTRRDPDPRRARWWLMGLTAVWVATVAVSPEFVWLAFLIWLLAGHLLPGWWAIGLSSLVLVVVVAAPVAHGGTTTLAGGVGPLVGAVFALGVSRGYLELLRDAAERERLVTSLTQAQQEMAELHDELARTQRHSGAVAERTRIARDIHDTVAQGLSSIRLLAHAAAERTSDPAARRTLDQVGAISTDSLADVRRIVAALAPSELDDDALAAALARMLERLHEQAGLETELHVDETLPSLPTSAEAALLRTAQSALANVRLHAHATRVVVSLIDAGDSARLDIVDDGAGFDVAAWEAASATDGTSYGLRFMRSRLRELGGGLDIESTPGEGTALSARLPIGAVAEEP